MKDALEIIRAREQAEDVKRLEGYHLLLDAEGPAPSQHAVHEYMLTMAAVLELTDCCSSVSYGPVTLAAVCSLTVMFGLAFSNSASILLSA